MNTSISTTTTPIDMSAITRANLQPTTKAQYTKALDNMRDAGVDPTDHQALQAYADGLKSSSKSFLKSALRIVTQDIEQELKANATPDNLPQVQAALYRLEAMREAVTVDTPKGTKANIWLSAAQVKQLTSLCDDTIEGRRDYVILACLLGAGLRREELATLTFDSLKTIPMKNGKMREVLEVTGKGAKTRVIPISQKLGDHLIAWRERVGGGNVARSLGMSKQIGESMSAVAIFKLVGKYGERIGIPLLAPHDLRRTFAQLGYEAGVPLTQISTLLGHANVATTQKYLNLALDLESTASDFIPLA